MAACRHSAHGMRSIVINVASFANVGPLGEFRILAYLVCALRFVIALKLTEEEQDNLDIWLAPPAMMAVAAE